MPAPGSSSTGAMQALWRPWSASCDRVARSSPWPPMWGSPATSSGWSGPPAMPSARRRPGQQRGACQSGGQAARPDARAMGRGHPVEPDKRLPVHAGRRRGAGRRGHARRHRQHQLVRRPSGPSLSWPPTTRRRVGSRRSPEPPHSSSRPIDIRVNAVAPGAIRTATQRRGPREPFAVARPRSRSGGSANPRRSRRPSSSWRRGPHRTSPAKRLIVDGGATAQLRPAQFDPPHAEPASAIRVPMEVRVSDAASCPTTWSSGASGPSRSRCRWRPRSGGRRAPSPRASSSSCSSRPASTSASATRTPG